MKKILFILCTVLLMSGCAGQSNNESIEPETFTGTGRGRNGDIVVETTFLGNEIQSIIIKEHAESPIIADPALTIIPEEVTNHQTLNVDMVTGATMTARGILAAVEDCLTQAGLPVENYQKTVEKTHTEETLSADVLVVGAGGAGLSAAIEAADQGATVILLEKLSSVGGSAELSMGVIISGGEEGNPDAIMTEAEHVQQLKNYKGGNEAFNESLLDDYGANIVENAEWAIAQGFKGTYIPWESSVAMSPEDESGVLPTGVVLSANEIAFGQGAYITDAFEKTAKSKGVEIYVNTPATELIVDEVGAVIGAKAYNSVTDTEYTISAKAVVLAAGGFAANNEMQDEYRKLCTNPKGVGAYIGAAGNTGDGIKMAEAVGAKTGMYYTDNGIEGDSTAYWSIGGVYINEKAQVLNNEGNPIDNLYSAGEMTDMMIMGDVYTICGTFNGWSIYSGRIAGQYAALEE